MSIHAEIAAEIVRALEGGPPIVVATLIASPSDNIGAKRLVRADGTTLGSLGLPALDEAIERAADDNLRRHRGTTVVLLGGAGEVVRPSAASGSEHQVMVEVHERPAHLLIAGGGHVGKALSQMAAMCGFRVTVVDDRPEYADPERFPEADRVIRGRFDEVLAEFPVDANTYIVAVTRGHKHDEVSLQRVVGRGAAYVGMIGSKRRAKAVLQHLVEVGADPEAVAAVHSPIGLDIGAETPEEIAVAIMGEIIGVRRGKGA